MTHMSQVTPIVLVQFVALLGREHRNQQLPRPLLRYLPQPLLFFVLFSELFLFRSIHPSACCPSPGRTVRDESQASRSDRRYRTSRPTCTYGTPPRPVDLQATSVGALTPMYFAASAVVIVTDVLSSLFMFLPQPRSMENKLYWTDLHPQHVVPYGVPDG